MISPKIYLILPVYNYRNKIVKERFKSVNLDGWDQTHNNIIISKFTVNVNISKIRIWM
jgi:hypothetical protein